MGGWRLPTNNEDRCIAITHKSVQCSYEQDLGFFCATHEGYYRKIRDKYLYYKTELERLDKLMKK